MPKGESMLRCFVVPLLVIIAPGAASAQWTIGIRSGYAVPVGDASKGATMADYVKSQVPVHADLFIQTEEGIGVGGYFAYGLGQGSGGEGAATTRFGLQLRYTFNMMNSRLAPWAGYEVGYEGVSTTLSGKRFDLGGLEIAPEGGVLYKVNASFSFGPYLQYAVGNYTSVSNAGASGRIPNGDQTFHQWFGLGIGGQFSL